MKNKTLRTSHIILYALLLACSNLYAQNILRLENNSYRNNDKLVYNVFNFENNARCGDKQVWDISHCAISNTEYNIEYSIDDNGIYISNDKNEIKTFKLCSNLFFQCGEENRLLKLQYTKPKLSKAFPFQYGDSISGTFEGRGVYCEKYDTEVKGDVFVKAVGLGILVTNDNDTLNNVLQVHTKSVKDVKMRNDSFQTNTTDIKQEIEERDEWYAKGFRYPVLIEINNTSYYNHKPVATCKKSYLLSLRDYNIFNDSANEKNIEENKDDVNVGQEKSLLSYNIKINGAHVTIDFSTECNTEVKATITDSSGIVYKRANKYLKGRSVQNLDFDCSGLRNGQYILCIYANEKVFCNTINI